MERIFAKFASSMAHVAGTPFVFLACVLLVVAWGITGPFFHYSETWQLIINTSTTIITFLMVFLIQNTQNRDGRALQTKIDELIRVSDAENEMMGIEKLTDKELDALHARCEEKANRAAQIANKARTEKKSRSQGKDGQKSSRA